ncbi:cache domain-containing protein [Defluviimonas sp. WL0002]|uniref:histidine kinase n=1 Tax=Albidovulum marisflavi TaxID=2984159 RepID=A0ABT2ZEP0_9RHOB|nr:cache domain-containing protein [Defluviimonas sp. WL0002]MCV2869221.1 cache domain-containing protein [Defluviimonas sp. WL0002]
MSEGASSASLGGLPFRKSVRARLLLIALIPTLILLPLLLLSTAKNWTDRFEQVLIDRVGGELTIAHQHLAGLLASRGADVAALSRSAEFASIDPRRGDALADFLERQRQALGLDFLYFVDRRGAVTMSPRNGTMSAPLDWPVVAAALKGQSRTEIDIFLPSDLAEISSHLAEHASLQLVPTEAAVPSDRSEEERGMIVHAAAPAPGGALVSGTLLNRNLGFIDEINNLVYPVGSLPGDRQGTATLFLDDVRISTNVRLFEDVRALGTRVSAAVRASVLDDGQVWRDRAFVVNDWYVSAYEPVIDSFGKRVGMLYVGFLERPFRDAQRATLIEIAITFALVIAIAVPVLLRWARGIFAPLERMNATIEQVEAGDLGARTGAQTGQDEISRVSAHLDTLLDQLQDRDRRLREWAEELERRVTERTLDLENANRELETTTRQLIVSEKLAAIGEITAGVAHEINNPLAVIQGNLDVVRDDLGARAKPLSTEFSLIQEQIQAIHVLVSKLLRFARPEEYADDDTGTDPGQVIHDTLPLVQHILSKSEIRIELNLRSAGQIALNGTELQQVLVNLMVNAIQAMPDGGTLTLGTERVEESEIGQAMRIIVRDTGHGMPPEIVNRIFDPFFTTKRSLGTGLGLSISRKIVAQAGGRISAESVEGRGTTFEILLPLVPNAV